MSSSARPVKTLLWPRTLNASAHPKTCKRKSQRDEIAFGRFVLAAHHNDKLGTQWNASLSM
jgi:hypothetical protein